MLLYHDRIVKTRPVVLVVEDDAELRRLYRTTLTIWGYDVRDAADGLAALTLIDREPPDVVVLDLGLPGFSGHAVSAELAENGTTRHIPVIIVTSAEEDLDGLDARCVLRKSASPERLLAEVRRCLADADDRTPA